MAWSQGKMEDSWYWWELWLLVRKIGIMCCGLFNSSTPERGWYLGSGVVIIALCMHSCLLQGTPCHNPATYFPCSLSLYGISVPRSRYARPYKDDLIDLCEFVSLLSTLLIFQMGMVWQAQAMDPNGELTQILEKASIVLILLTSLLGLGVEGKMFAARHEGADDLIDGDASTAFANPMAGGEDGELGDEVMEDFKDITDNLG